MPAEELVGRYVGADLVNEQTGEVIAEAGDELTAELVEALAEAGITELPTLHIDHVNVGPYIRNTLAVDKNTNRAEALTDIYRVMRPGEPPTPETAEALFQGLFFDSERYDLSPVGRVKMNARLGQRDRRPAPHAAQGGHPRGGEGAGAISRTAAARSTTSTTSATAACARSAS